MRKLIIILSLFITTSIFSQVAPWTGWQSLALKDSLDVRDDSLTALRNSYNLLTGSTMLPLASAKVYVGSSLGLPVAQTVTGGLSVTNTGVWSIASGYITNSMLSNTARISPGKIGTSGAYIIDDNEYYALDGIDGNIQEKFDAINYGTGFLLSAGDTATGNIVFEDGIKSIYGTTLDFSVYHSGTFAWIYNITGNMLIRNYANAKISLYTNDIERWNISSGGNLVPFLTDTYNIGTSAARPDTVFAGNVIANGVDLGTVLGTHSTTAAVKQFISDSLLARELDPIVFTISYPTTGDVIGPFRVHRDITLTSAYLYLIGGTSVTYNVFYNTSVNTNALIGTIPSFFDANEVGTPTSGVQVTSNTFETTPSEGHWIWCKIVSVSGSPTRFSLTLNKSGR